MIVPIELAKVGDEVLNSFDAELPKELFHYTNAAGLIGILENRELHATDLRCMNDTGELALGYFLIKNALDKRMNHPAHFLFSSLLNHPAFTSGLVFSFSFRKNRDLLSQWRAYADDGAGFAIGFMSEALSSLRINDKDPMHHIVRVEYETGRQETLAQRLVDRCLDVLNSNVGEELDPQEEQFLVTALALVLPAFASMCKTSGFSEEKEYRLIFRSHQDPILRPGSAPQFTMPKCHFRAGKYGLTPFVKLSFWSAPH